MLKFKSCLCFLSAFILPWFLSVSVSLLFPFSVCKFFCRNEMEYQDKIEVAFSPTALSLHNSPTYFRSSCLKCSVPSHENVTAAEGRCGFWKTAITVVVKTRISYVAHFPNLNDPIFHYIFFNTQKQHLCLMVF